MMCLKMLWRLNYDKFYAARQAELTDNVPLHVLGGNIIPIALGSQFMLTQAVRNASHALVVAFPKANSTYAGSLASLPCPVWLHMFARYSHHRVAARCDGIQNCQGLIKSQHVFAESSHLNCML